MQLVRIVILVSLALVWVNRPVDAQVQVPRSIEIRLATDSDLEKQARLQLERILAKWDLSQWLFTRTVQIRSGVIPHSHPVLTLNTNSLADDTIKLKSFVHEQLHWFMSRYHAAADSATAELLPLYPDVPSDPVAGAGDRESTYLHLLVGILEFDALRELFDEATARRLLARTPFYTWIYREVLERPEPIRNVLRKYRLAAPDARR
jgi:hypothetical protein